MSARKNCLLLMSLLQLSSAQFVFEFKIINVSTKVADCDWIRPACETYLNRFCLRERGYPRSLNDSDCPLGSSEMLDPDDANLPISRQILSGRSWPGGFQMFIRAYDSDIGPDDHLDNIFIEMELTESSNFTTMEEFAGDMNRVSVNMTFRVMMCPENFYGPNCNMRCLAQNDSENGHFTCNDDGSIKCLPGFENVNNSCRDVVNPCDSSPCANNGNCTAMGSFNYICLCTPGYTGPACEDEIDGCLSITCPNNSMCVNGSVCVCPPGFEFIGDICKPRPTDPTASVSIPDNTGNQAGTPVIIGSAVGGAVVLILVLFILIAVIVITTKQRSQPHEKLPAEDGSLSPYESHEQDMKFEMTQRTPLGAKDSTTDSPTYDQVSPVHTSDHSQQQQSSMSDSTVNDKSVNIAANPVYGADTSHSQSRHSTIRHVQNPVYGDPSDKNTDGNVYSSPDQLLSAQSMTNNSGKLEYSYAIIESSASNCAVSKTSHDRNGSLEPLVEHEYTIVDKPKETGNIAALSHDQAAPSYEHLQHGQGTTEQSQTQATVRLAENEDLGYSALT